MSRRHPLAGRAALFFSLLLTLACREPAEGPAAADLAMPLVDLAMPSDLARPADLTRPVDLAGPLANPPPAMCNQRKPGVTAIQVLVSVDEYKGTQMGRNGTHEIVHGTITLTPWVYDRSLIDTSNVEVAMNISTATNPEGLPKEIPMRPGQTFEVEGEYIPKATASASTAKGPAAVIHYTHNPCGYAVIGGTTYK